LQQGSETKKAKKKRKKGRKAQKDNFKRSNLRHPLCIHPGPAAGAAWRANISTQRKTKKEEKEKTNPANVNFWLFALSKRHKLT
jgi:hypothetical protein